MQFMGTLEGEAQRRVEECDSLLTNPRRLEALKKTGLMDTPREEAFDRLASLAASALRAPLTIVSLVSAEKQFFKAAHGLPAPMDVIREIPITGSICRYTLQGEAIIADDAASDPLLRFHPATGPWGIGAFIAIPMLTRSGYALGAFCAVHPKPHAWSAEEIHLMKELTASIMTEIELREQISELTRERDLRDRLVMTLTHDLRTPLTSAKLGVQLVAGGRTDLTRSREIASRVNYNLDRADRMIQNILDANLVKSGEMLPVRKSRFDLSVLAHLVLTDLSVSHGERFTARIAEGIELFADPGAVQRMLENLLQNALKYGSNVEKVALEVTRSPQSVEIHVRNWGNPIPESDWQSIFEPFHRTTSAKTGASSGWGLGLAIVRSLAEAHHGTASVRSSEGEGTVFTLRFPAALPN